MLRQTQKTIVAPSTVRFNDRALWFGASGAKYCTPTKPRSPEQTGVYQSLSRPPEHHLQRWKVRRPRQKSQNHFSIVLVSVLTIYTVAAKAIAASLKKWLGIRSAAGLRHMVQLPVCSR